MPIYQKLPERIKAKLWLKVGDHEKIKAYEPVHVGNENSRCNVCGEMLKQHGEFTSETYEFVVCPGDYVVTNEDGTYAKMDHEFFDKNYELVGYAQDEV